MNRKISEILLLSLLMQYKEKGETITDIKIDRGSLEQHFIKIAKGGVTMGAFYTEFLYNGS